LVRIQGDAKDPSALYLADPEHFRENWRGALDAAVSWAQIEREEREQGRSSAEKASANLAQQSVILDMLIEDARKLGMVGEERQAKIVYLAIVSRFLENPISVAVKGPSSAGKSFCAKTVVRFFPESAVYSLSAMSEKALIYSEEPLA